MSLKDYVDSKIKKCSWIDIQCIKLSVFAFALVAAKLWPPLLSLEWYWYAAVFVLAALKPAYRMMK